MRADYTIGAIHELILDRNIGWQCYDRAERTIEQLRIELAELKEELRNERAKSAGMGKGRAVRGVRKSRTKR